MELKSFNYMGNVWFGAALKHFRIDPLEVEQKERENAKDNNGNNEKTEIESNENNAGPLVVEEESEVETDPLIVEKTSEQWN